MRRISQDFYIAYYPPEIRRTRVNLLPKRYYGFGAGEFRINSSEAILALKPATFRYKQELDPAGIPQFGLVAEQVEKVNPDLVARDDQGKPYTVRYEAVNAMSLNEFLKEHRKNEDQQAMIARLEKQVTMLTAGLQKVNAQLELKKCAPEMVSNNQ